MQTKKLDTKSSQKIGGVALPLLFPPKGDIIEICFPSAEKPQMRKIVARSKTQPTFKYPSWKMKRMLEGESTNELNAFRLCDADPYIKYFSEQALAIQFYLDGGLHWHIPDLLVITNLGKELWEVKPERFATDPWVKMRTAFLSSALQANGYKYRLVIGEDLRRQPRLMNAVTIVRNGRRPISDNTREQLRLIFSREHKVTWQNLIPRAESLRSGVCRLILEGHIGIDMEQAITPKTNLWWKSTSNSQGGF